MTILILFFIFLLAISMRAVFLLIRNPTSPTDVALLLAVKQGIASHYILTNNPLAGFPNPHFYYAEPGIVYLAIIPYYFIGGTLGLLGTLYFVKILFTLAGVVIVYLFAKRITSSKQAGFLASIFYAISQIGSLNESFNRWHGDAFFDILMVITIFLLLLFIEKLRTKDKRGMILVFSGFLILSCMSYFIWNGGAYLIAVLFFICISLVISSREPRLSRLLFIGIIPIASSWAVILLLQLHPLALQIPIISNLLAPILNSVLLPSPQALLTNLIYLVGQFGLPSFTPTNITIHFTLPFILWLSVGLFTVLLGILAIKRYPYLAHTISEQQAFIACVTMFLLGASIAIFLSFTSLLFIPLAILGGTSITVIKPKERKVFLSLLLTSSFLIYSFTLYNIANAGVYLGSDQQFQTQLLWLSNNTAANATFLAYDADATSIEFWANRTVYDDSNFADNPHLLSNYSSFLLAQAYNFSYLARIKPDYLLLRDYPSGNTTYPNNMELFQRGLQTLNGSDNVSLSLFYNENRTLIYRVRTNK